MKNISSMTLWAVILFFSFTISYAQKPSAETLKKDVYYLASDSLTGRKPGTPGGNKAAEYVRDAFKSAGLQLLGENGFQYFEVTTDVKAGNNNSFAFKDFEGKISVDYSPFSFSSNATVSGEVVFAGYGFDINLDTLKWNDYKDIDVTGKWVMLLRGNPETDNEKSVFVEYSRERSKVLTARDKGAAGVLFVTGVAADKNDELVSLSFDKSMAGSGIPVINIKRAVADKLLAPENLKIEDLESEINTKKITKTVKISTLVSATTDLSFTKVQTENVVAILPGSDPLLKNEYIVVGAHYDHLGMGGPGSGSRKPDTVAVHHGADDNASGTTSVMELARWAKTLKTPLKRSVVFIAFGAEEMGILGSAWFVSHPLVDLKKVVLMINFDMVGRLKEKDPVISIGGTGTSAEIVPILDKYTKGKSYRTSYSPEGYGPSDHASFYGENVPVLYFNTGVHEDYHTPEDLASRINYKGMLEVIALAENLITDLAGSDQKLTFKEAGPKTQNTHGYGFKVKLGIMPDFTNTEIKGVGVGAVTKGGPADKGGLLKGDIITALNGKPVENIYEYMDRLKTFTAGQTISVDVTRGKEKKVFIVQL